MRKNKEIREGEKKNRGIFLGILKKLNYYRLTEKNIN